jgi:hypothetical protein
MVNGGEVEIGRAASLHRNPHTLSNIEEKLQAQRNAVRARWIGRGG